MPTTTPSSHTPRLRFPGFTGSWEVKKLWEIWKNKIEKNKDHSINFVLTNSAVLWIVSQESFFDKDIANSDNTNWYYIVDVWDFVYNPRISNNAPYGPIKQNKLKKWIMSPLYTIFSIDKWNKDFYTYYFETTRRHKYLHNNGNSWARSDRLNISNKDFYNMSLISPTLPEQTKIASFLSAVDDKISSLTDLMSARAQYKSGMMSRIFSQEIRFLDDHWQSFPGWEEKKLGEVCDLQNWYAFESSTYNESWQFGIITIANVQNWKIDLSQFNKMENIPKDLKKYQILKQGDILISMTGNVGRICIIDEDNFLLNQRVWKLEPKNINSEFLYQTLRQDKFLFKMTQLAQWWAQPNIWKFDILWYLLKLPSPPEQTKIANFFSQIDHHISDLETQIETAKQWKKGLLQGLFI